MKKKDFINNPPRYENLTNKTSLEYGISKELIEVADELQTLTRNIQDLDESFIGRMKRNSLSWEDIFNELEDLRNEIERVSEFILEKFD